MNELNKKLWLETLRECCHCVPDEDGNMPCDNGVVCDRCYRPDVNAVYTAKLEALQELLDDPDIQKLLDNDAE